MTTDHSQEKKLINMLAIEAAELWLQRFEKIQDAKAPNQNNAGIHVEIGRIDSRFHTAYWSLYSSLAQHIERTIESIEKEFRLVEFDWDPVDRIPRILATWADSHRVPQQRQDFFKYVMNSMRHRAIDQVRRGKRVRFANKEPILPSQPDQGRASLFPSANSETMNGFRIESMPTHTEMALIDLDSKFQEIHKALTNRKTLGLLLFVAGVSCEGYEVFGHESTLYNSRERRFFASQERSYFVNADENKGWELNLLKRNYWLLMKSQAIWERVVYPVTKLQLQAPEHYKTFRHAFVQESLGAIVAATIMGGWVFYDSSESWFSSVESSFDNTSTNNFLTVSILDPSAKNASAFRCLRQMYRGNDNLESAWESWKEDNAAVWRHLHAMPPESIRETLRCIEGFEERQLDFGYYQNLPLPMTPENTRSYLRFADLPFTGRHASQGKYRNSIFSLRDEKLTFSSNSVRRKKSKE